VKPVLGVDGQDAGGGTGGAEKSDDGIGHEGRILKAPERRPLVRDSAGASSSGV
jgi:hypothetical protein